MFNHLLFFWGLYTLSKFNIEQVSFVLSESVAIKFNFKVLDSTVDYNVFEL